MIRSASRSLALAALVLVTTVVEVQAEDKPIYGITNGPAKGAGSIDVTLKWVKAGVKSEKKKTVNIADGDTRDTIRNNIVAALNGDAAIGADWNFANKDGQDGTRGMIGTPIGGSQMTGGFAKANTTTEFGWVVAGDPPPNASLFFDLEGSNGQAVDLFNVHLSTLDDPSAPNIDTFSLGSYAGLTPSQIENQLASMIDAHPSYAAQVVDLGGGNQRVKVTGASLVYGMHVFRSTTSGSLSFDTTAGFDNPDASIPTMSQHGMIVLALLLLSAGSFILFRQRRAPLSNGTSAR